MTGLKPIYPKYEYQLTDKPLKACSTYLSAKNPLNKSNRERRFKGEPDLKLNTNVIDWKGKDRGLFFQHTQSNVNVICSQFSEDCQTPKPVICRERTKTRCTQTRYRESSAQTHPYQPEVAGDKEIYQNFEVYEISKLLSSHEPPGEYEAKVVERARRRRKYKNALKSVINDKIKHRAILEAIEWQDWVAREEEVQYCQWLRMQIVLKMFENREKNFQNLSQQRMALSSVRIQTKRLSQLQKINVEFGREMRRIEFQKQKIARNYSKANITKEHIDPASDLHAPQMRFGVNPNRRHFVGFRKKFDDRIDDLYKQKDGRGLSSLTCPFSKLKNWSKPKERVTEISQRFCSDGNLKNLYESLKGLRTIAEAHKPSPKCLKKRSKSVQKETEPHGKLVTHPEKEKQRTKLEETLYSPGIEEQSEVGDTLLAEMLRQKRAKELSLMKTDEIASILGEFEGTSLGNLQQFLHDELERLKLLKKFHAIHMLAERERWKREAHEAGCRQKENKLREDHEVLYTAAQEVHKDTASLFLQSVLEEEFQFTAEKLAEDKIIELAKEIDIQDLDSIMLQGKDRLVYNRVVIGEYVREQVFGLVEKRLAKMKADKLNEAVGKVLDEELFASVENALAANYKTPESVCIVGELLDEIIVDSVVYDFDIITPDTEDEFNVQNEIDEIINKLVRLAIKQRSVTEDFSDSTEYQTFLEGQKEARAIMGKLVKIAVPAEPWKLESERIVEQTLSETFDDAVYDIEFFKASRIVRDDDRLQEIISEIYARLGNNKKSVTKIAIEESSGSTMSGHLPSIRSTIDIFERFSSNLSSSSSSEIVANNGEQMDMYSAKKVVYMQAEKLEKSEPAEIGRRHERFDITHKVAKRYRDEEKGGINGAESFIEDSDSDLPASVERIKFTTEIVGLGLTPTVSDNRSSRAWLRTFHPELLANQGRMFDVRSSASYERANTRYERLIKFPVEKRKPKGSKRRTSI